MTAIVASVITHRVYVGQYCGRGLLDEGIQTKIFPSSRPHSSQGKTGRYRQNQSNFTKYKTTTAVRLYYYY